MRKLAIVLGVAIASPFAAASPLAASKPAIVAAALGRVVPLEGGRNFRDVGGYRTTTGQTVRSGLLYRSGSLGKLTAHDEQLIDGLGVRSIIDLRSTPERRSDVAAAWLAESRHGYWTRDYGLSMGDTARAFSNSQALTRDSMLAMMGQAYRSMIKEQAPAYRELFARLIADRGPVIVNCTAGKDRTGIAAALVLTALGVPYPTVREDFLLSNGAFDPAGLRKDLPPPLAKLPDDVLQPLLGVDGSYLDAAFDQMRREYGSVDAYLARELGIGPRQIAALRRRMLV